MSPCLRGKPLDSRIRFNSTTLEIKLEEHDDWPGSDVTIPTVDPQPTTTGGSAVRAIVSTGAFWEPRTSSGITLY
jgi:hypothetical protein